MPSTARSPTSLDLPPQTERRAASWFRDHALKQDYESGKQKTPRYRFVTPSSESPGNVQASEEGWE